MGSLLMKKTLLALGIPWLIFAGCVHRTVYVQQPATATVVEPAPAQPTEIVTVAPPPPQREVVVVRPGPGFVWTPGYWAWNGRWVWVGGQWVRPPRPRAVWVSGRWVRRGPGFVWVGGRWR